MTEDGLSQISTLEYDLTEVSLSEFQHCHSDGSPAFYVATLTLKMRVASEGLRVQLWLKDRIVSAVILADPMLKNLVTVPLD